MSKSISFVVVGMVGIVALVALVVLFSPNLNLGDNLAGQAINYEFDTTEALGDEYELKGVTVGTKERTKTTKEVEEVTVIYNLEEEIETIEPEAQVITEIQQEIMPYEEGTGTGVVEDYTEEGEEASDIPPEIAAEEPIPTDTTNITPVTGPVATPSCTDSDAGFDLANRGTTTGPDEHNVVVNHVDSCLGSRNVLEGTCEDGVVSVTSERCPRGGRCIGGACSR